MDIKPKPTLILVLFHFLINFNIHFLFGAETISANQSLSGDDTIVSAGEVFVLGFFKPGKTSNYYIGMWYKRDPYQTIVWVANREQPVMDRFSSEFRISGSNLVLFNESNIPIWSTNVNSTTSSTTSVKAVLQDNGNLVLFDDGLSDKSKLLWQSFDYPTDTWLPGASLGFNKITKRKQVLTSWKSPEDPAPGVFTFELNTSDVSYISIWNRSRSFWTTGSWNGQDFTLVPETKRNSVCKVEYVSNHSVITFNMYALNSTAISQLMIHFSGQLKQLLWLPNNGWDSLWSFPRQQCQVYAFCGAYGSCSENSMPFCQCLKGFKPKSQNDWDLQDYSEGCVRKSELHCGNNTSLTNEKKDRFLELPSVSSPEDEESKRVGNVEECESICLRKCSCIAYAYDNKVCSIWTRDLLNLKQLSPGDTNGRTLYIRLAASEFPSPKKNKGKFVGVVVSFALVLISLLGCLFLSILRQRKNSMGTGTSVGGSLMVFRYRDLQNATKNFSNKLGEGGFGSVFKGILSDSTEVAVKKLESVHQGEKQFRTEVSTIGTIQHVNLVRLRGFCSQGTKKLLVYDYMPNGSLNTHLFCEKGSNILDWKTRFQIALGTARGLVYLHDKCRECIIHCDIKPENILLDAEFNPKVADFGLAKLVSREFSRVLTTIRGTRGYLAPEWISGVAITFKADVYSYGMVLFELISGKRNTEICEDGKVRFFASQAASHIVRGGDVLSLLDPRLDGNADIEELKRVCVVACWCIQDCEFQRPSMSRVVQMLEGIIEVNLPPVPRSLKLVVDSNQSIVFYTESSSNQSSQSQVPSDTSYVSSFVDHQISIVNVV
ncbi:G-type lectin S-receptor-like serine/threonine-protein kinase At2g19130 [Cannabis sativa]|uniref:G-type lectin S-receptor-like serine/threonine-protein kinase At2g19130 n=1 Tax=Cannabis sativa TaxID=3483 RepID=UPI0011E03677|nr:G-type lectin S-receptor-like serine/threonine-protein kinase At2g19130 [Cannabis sativa]